MSFDQQIAAIERWAGVPLSHEYRTLLFNRGGHFVGDLVRFYSADEVIERNECYEAGLYCQGFLTIGDDGGGRAVVINPQLMPTAVFVVDHGSVSQDDFVRVSDSLPDWVNKGCPL